MTDIPLASSGLKPRGVRIRLEAPEKFTKLNLRLHIMSDSYIGVDWESKIVLEVAPRSTKTPSAMMKQEEVAKRIINMSKCGQTPESLAKATLQYVTGNPKQRKKTGPCGDHAAPVKKSSKVCRLCGQKMAEKSVEDNLECSDGNSKAQDSLKRIDCSTPVTTGKGVLVESAQDIIYPTDAISSSAESSFTWWEVLRALKQQEAKGLAKHTPDTLDGNYWMHMDSCNADVDCVSVKSDFLDEGEENWVDTDDEVGHSDLEPENNSLANHKVLSQDETAPPGTSLLDRITSAFTADEADPWDRSCPEDMSVKIVELCGSKEHSNIEYDLSSREASTSANEATYEGEEELELDGELEVEEEPKPVASLVIDMDEIDERTDEEESDEALAEDGD
jgi:hypothetical protein